jgi:hypothetical protein
MQEIGFDIISDLYLTPDESFSWENKATSLYCIVAGNISKDLRTVIQVLIHLSTKYQGVFFVPGRLEYEECENIVKRTEELNAIALGIPNICMLHQNVVVIDGIALLGTNGWANIENNLTANNIIMSAARYEDFSYLTKCLTKLQRHLDVKKIILITNAIPNIDLYFGEVPENLSDQIPLCEILQADTEHKVTHWVFGTYNKNVDVNSNNINYLNNPYNHSMPYYAKRLSVLI